MANKKIPEILFGSTTYLQSLNGCQLNSFGEGASLIYKETIRAKVGIMLNSLLDNDLHLLPLGEKNAKLSNISFFNDYSLRMKRIGEKIFAVFSVDNFSSGYFKEGTPMEIFYIEQELNANKKPQRKGVEANILEIEENTSQIVVEILSKEIKNLSPRKSYRINVGDDRIELDTMGSLSLETSEISDISGNGFAMRYIPANKDENFTKDLTYNFKLKSNLDTNDSEVEISAKVVRETKKGKYHFVAFQIYPKSNEDLMELLAAIQRDNAKNKVRTSTN